MSIAAVNHDNHSTPPLEADIAQIAHDIQRLRDIVHAPIVDAVRFAQLERSVSFRLDIIAHVLATQDTAAHV